MRLALVVFLFTALAHAAAPERVFIQSFRGRAGKQFHKAGCEDLYGVIKSLTLDTAIATHEACTKCWSEPPTAAATADAPTPEKVAQLMEVSGLKKQLEQVPLLIAAGSSRPGPGGQPVDPRVTAALAEAFRAPALIEFVARAIRQKTKAAAVDGTIKVMGSPSVKKFTQLEQDAATPEGAKGLPDFVSELAAKPPTPLRRAAIERLDELYGLTDLQVDILLAFALAIPRAKARQDPRNRAIAQQLEDQAAALREQLKPGIRDAALGGLFYAYRTASDDELTKYLGEFEGSADVKAVSEAMRDGLRTGIEQAASQAGEKLMLQLLAAPPAPKTPPADAAAPEASASPP